MYKFKPLDEQTNNAFILNSLDVVKSNNMVKVNVSYCVNLKQYEQINFYLFTQLLKMCPGGGGR